MVGTQPAQSLPDATRNLEPDEPLPSGHEWYVDLMPARGGNVITKLLKHFERKRLGAFLHVVFASHRGAGKSTELNQFMVKTETRFASLYVEANLEFDSKHLDMEDFLLVTARAVERFMREERKTPLDNQLLERVEKWFEEKILETTFDDKYVGSLKSGITAKAGVPFFATLFGTLTALIKTESSHRTKIKQEIRKSPGTLLDLTNRLLANANDILGGQGLQLLVIVDNLDRYKPAIVDNLLVEESDTFKLLQANFILTPPIELILSPESQKMDQLYKCVTMPSVTLRDKQDDYEKIEGIGVDLLRKALSNRIDLQRLFPDESVQKQLIAYCGGSIRELIQLAQEATLEADTETVSAADMSRVLRQARQRLRDQVLLNGYLEPLARIAATKDIFNDEVCLDLLYYRYALQYNGDTWYDAHPLLASVPEFQRAVAEAKEKYKVLIK